MEIVPVGEESLGVRSMCLYVETRDLRILLDAGVSLAPRRFGLPPHPLELQRAREVREQILRLAAYADVVTISHYHRDHFTVPYPSQYMEMKVADCALDKEPVVKHDDDVKKAVTIMTTRSMSALPVVDDYGNFLGAVYLFELLGKSGRVGKYARKIPHVSPESSLLEALQVIGQTGLT